MGISHDQNVAADAGHPSPFYGAAIDGDKFAHHIVVAHLETGRFALITQVLRTEADRGERKEAIAGANRGGALNHHLRDQFTAIPQFDSRPHHAVRADSRRTGDFCGRMDDGGGMDVHEKSSPWRLAISRRALRAFSGSSVVKSR